MYNLSVHGVCVCVCVCARVQARACRGTPYSIQLGSLLPEHVWCVYVHACTCVCVVCCMPQQDVDVSCTIALVTSLHEHILGCTSS